MSKRTSTAYVAVAAIGGLLAPASWGQTPTPLDELKTWHDKLARPNVVASAEDGRQARAKLAEWNLPVPELTPEQRGQWLRLVLHAALAVGDAAKAAEVLPELEQRFPDARDTLRAAWLVAGATGDAEKAQRTLARLKQAELASEAALARRTQRLALIGQAAPDVRVATEGGATVALRARDGAVLVLDFWSLRDQPTARQVKALRDLRAQYARRPNVEFLGVNSDPPSDAAAARDFARDSGYDWPQHYEQTAGEAPLSDQVFRVASRPWHVLIDGEGNIRAVGAAGEPEFEYAVRAAVAEAHGECAVIRPRTVAGRVAEAPPAVRPTGDAHAEAGQPTEAYVPKSDLPHNEEAKRLLDQARVYLKTGRKTDAKKLLQEIVDKYPGTYEAREAEERLQAL